MRSLNDLVFGSLGKALGLPGMGAGLASALSLGIGAVRPRRAPSGVPYQIIVYHRVIPDDDLFAIAPVGETLFNRQMEILSRHFRPVSLGRLMDQLKDGTVAPGTVCVTFDDGYLDNYTHAYPALRRHGVPATIFLATDYVGGTRKVWHDRVLSAFKGGKARRFSLAEAGLADRPMETGKERIDIAFHVLAWLKTFPPAVRDERILSVFAACGAEESDGERLMLDWDEVREMMRGGIEFGAHTLSHPILSTLTEAEMEKEIMGSRSEMESRLGSPVRLFAYPNGRKGDYNETTKRLLSKNGFICAVTTNPGVNHGLPDPFEIMRRQPWDRTAEIFHARILLESLLS